MADVIDKQRAANNGYDQILRMKARGHDEGVEISTWKHIKAAYDENPENGAEPVAGWNGGRGNRGNADRHQD